LAEFQRHAQNLAQENEARQREVAELRQHAQNLARENEAREAEVAEMQRYIHELTGEFESGQRETADLQQHAQNLAGENEAREAEAAELRQAVAELEEQARQLTDRVRLMAEREKELREMLLDAHDQLLRRDEEIQAALVTALQQHAPPAKAREAAPVVTGAIAPDKGSVPGHYLVYQRLLHQIREVVNAELPPDATVVVVSKGDDQLLQLGGRTAWHFPQNEAGVYAGYNPADSAAAIKHLEELRAKGGDFLLFPGTGLWWLDHYREFREHLEARYPTVVRRDDVCVIFALRGAAVSEKEQYGHLVERVREVVDRALPPDATVLVVSRGDEELLKLGKRTAWHFPQTEAGAYAGHNPADSAAAIKHLEELRAKGGEYLLFPNTGLWWLDYYREFRQHLQTHYREVVRQEDTCVIFAPQKERVVAHEEEEVRPPTAARAALPFGVNVAGNFGSEKGTGEAVRSMVRSLRAADIPCALNNCTDAYSVNPDRDITQFSDDNPYGINLIHLNADCVPEFVEHRGEAYLRGRYNVGYWAWELSDFPQEWESSFRHLDEVWVPSNFVLDAVSRAAPVPVVRIPHAVSEHLAVRPWQRSHFGLPPDKFLFLFLFDFMSITERKNPFGLINAFKKAFRKQDDAVLVLKCSHSSPALLKAVGAPTDVVREVKEAAAGANIHLMDGVLSREETNTLLFLSDCYVSLHRSEGFGLPLAEAMSLEKPVIATAYSGNMDFMTPANSFLVKYTLAELERDCGPYRKGCVWAEPDVDHAAELMRFVYENRTRAQEVGRKAREDVLLGLHPRVVGAQIKSRLLKLAGSGKVPAPDGARGGGAEHPAPREDAVMRKQLRYRRLTQDIRAAVRSALPPEATVLVVSKGDDELLQLGCREAWHFPRGEGGAYAGHYPADSAAAVAHVEELRAEGAQFLLFPGTALWWLEHYADFRRHLDDRYPRVWSDEACLIYELSGPPGAGAGRILKRQAANGSRDR
jgi:glycosyltransferase involved in cell wall biosynthesis